MIATTLQVEKIRKDFPMLARKVNGKPLIYLDNAATSQKPLSVIDAMHKFYTENYATIHRGAYALSQEATMATERVRESCRSFLNATNKTEIVFVRGATEAINLVATGYGRKFLKKGDEILITEMEHHANIVPWQQLCEEKGLKLQVAPMNDEGELILEAFKKKLSGNVKFVAVAHMSNALGTINPVKELIRWSHEAGAVVLIDGAQGIVHEKVDVQDLNCDFYCFSGHKIYGPSGIGVLYGKSEYLEAMNPYQFGGDMIDQVSFEKTTFAKPPLKFEAGTPAIVEIIGLGKALEYVSKLGFEAVHAYEQGLLIYATEKMLEVPGVRLVGTAKQKGAVVSFTMGDIHPHDIGTLLDQEGVAVRSGHHCAQPTMTRFGIPATARASFAFYNTEDEIDRLVESLHKVREIFTLDSGKET